MINIPARFAPATGLIVGIALGGIPFFLTDPMPGDWMGIPAGACLGLVSGLVVWSKDRKKSETT